jgi:DNA-binding NtrC family response regulator
VEVFEKRLVLETLRKADGNKSKAARMLGISEKNIRDRLKKWELKK